MEPLFEEGSTCVWLDGDDRQQMKTKRKRGTWRASSEIMVIMGDHFWGPFHPPFHRDLLYCIIFQFLDYFASVDLFFVRSVLSRGLQ